MVKHLLRSAWHLPRSVAVLLITGYQHTLSPDHGMLRVFFPGGCCMYKETCSNYGKRMMRERGFIVGSWKTLVRILSCHPWKTPTAEMRL